MLRKPSSRKRHHAQLDGLLAQHHRRRAFVDQRARIASLTTSNSKMPLRPL